MMKQQQQQHQRTNPSSPFTVFVWLLTFSSLTHIVVGWSSSFGKQPLQTVPPVISTTTLSLGTSQQQEEFNSKNRRDFVTSFIAVGTAVPFFVIPTTSVQAAAATTISKEDLLNDLTLSKEKLATIPALLEEKEWDKVRSILKVPPVNKLWNLGDVSLCVHFIVIFYEMHFFLIPTCCFVDLFLCVPTIIIIIIIICKKNSHKILLHN